MVHIPKAITAEDVIDGKVDKEGRVKIQDAAGNVIGDENKIRVEGSPEQKAFEELKKAAAAAQPPDPLTTSYGPSVHTSSKTSPFKERQAKAEKELEALGDQKTVEALQKRAFLSAQISELRELENRRVQGAPSRLPRGLVLDIGDLPSKYPDRHFRWVNIEAPGKAASALAMGYTRTSASEGGRQVGDLALFHTSQDNRAKRVADRELHNNQLVEAHKSEIRAAAERVVKEVYDRTGKDISKGTGTLLVEDR